jgi:hypothetical protein
MKKPFTTKPPERHRVQSKASPKENYNQSHTPESLRIGLPVVIKSNSRQVFQGYACYLKK